MKTLENTIQDLIDWGKANIVDFNENSLSDGYHTFDELYDFRKIYNATLFNEWAKSYDVHYSGLSNELPLPNRIKPHYNVHKSWKHNDGEWCFGKEKKWFIVSAMLPHGLISNHYKATDWDLFQVPEVEKAVFEFDGHTGKDVLERLRLLLS